MISIGIIVCDKDYLNCEKLLSQIKERVLVEHEVIIIDNRENNLDDKTSWKATFSFGYNAYQFAARAKIIELAKGDYIWFVDGDDCIIGLEEMPFTEDIIVYSYFNEPYGDGLLPDRIITSNIVSFENETLIKPVLWNKLIKKSLFSSYDLSYTESLKAVTMEDLVWCYMALLNAANIRVCSKVIYQHFCGVSNVQIIKDVAPIKHLVTGFNNLHKVMESLLQPYPDFYQKVISNQYRYLLSLITTELRVYNPDINTILKDTITTLSEIIPKEEYKNFLIKTLLPQIHDKSLFNVIKEISVEKYGEDCLNISLNRRYLSYDEEWGSYIVKNESYESEFPFIKDCSLEKKWPYKLSIILLVYDGNTEYLYPFTKNLYEKVRVDFEVIIVDNRDVKKSDLIYYGKSKIVNADGNKGILEGRRLGFENCTGDYVWFVDIDDNILDVINKDYGSADIIEFPFFSEGAFLYKSPELIKQENFWSVDKFLKITVYLWNKWIKAEVLKKAYEDIPHFFCIYHEDTLVNFTILKYANNLEFVHSTALYIHSKNNNSITLKNIASKKDVDRLFIGYKEVTEYMKVFSSLKIICLLNSRCNIRFYLKTMSNSDEKIKVYFKEVLYKLFSEEAVKEEFASCINESWAYRIKNYLL